jgi:DNA-directed RNA polymerase subunit RPC12/RpoP
MSKDQNAERLAPQQTDAERLATQQAEARRHADEQARRMLELEPSFIAGYRCMACVKRFFLPSHDCAEDIQAGLTCPRCGGSRIAPSGWYRVAKPQQQQQQLAQPTTPARR